MTEPEKPKPCPFCGCTETYMGETSLMGDVGSKYVVCQRCSASGPWCVAERTARNAWNRRKGETDR